MSVADRLGQNVRKFAIERIKTFKPNPAKFLAAVEKAEARGDAHVLKNLALAAEKFGGVGENAALGAKARQVFHDGAVLRADKLIKSKPVFDHAKDYTGYMNRVEEQVSANKQMLAKPIQDEAAATTAKAQGHAKLYPSLEAVLQDLERSKKTLQGPLEAARKDLVEAQRSLATAAPERKGQAQAWVDRVQTQIAKLEAEVEQMTTKPRSWVAKEQATYDTGMRPLITTLATATGEVKKVDAPTTTLLGDFKTLEGAIGRLKKMAWRVSQGFDPDAWSAAAKRLGL